ncbi:uncharacterized protein LOC135686301 [Rhopilema esculentum]|uniref:uncharacterized protein LOC135686301 n=1 Tax=Rhopilema esculentum TaxID=499914 RepID=UPI0031D086B2|eukprot:gene830-10572_t
MWSNTGADECYGFTNDANVQETNPEQNATEDHTESYENSDSWSAYYQNYPSNFNGAENYGFAGWENNIDPQGIWNQSSTWTTESSQNPESSWSMDTDEVGKAEMYNGYDAEPQYSSWQDEQQLQQPGGDQAIDIVPEEQQPLGARSYTALDLEQCDDIASLESMYKTIMCELEYLEEKIHWEEENGEKELQQEYEKIDSLYENQVAVMENSLASNETTIFNAAYVTADMKAKTKQIIAQAKSIANQTDDYEAAIFEQERKLKGQAKIYGEEGNEILAKVYELDSIIADEKEVHDEEIEDIDVAIKQMEDKVEGVNNCIERFVENARKKLDSEKEDLRKQLAEKERIISEMKRKNSSMIDTLNKSEKKLNWKQKILRFFRR